MENDAYFEKTTVWTSKTLGYFCYRIPAIIITKKGTLIAFCEARERSCNDWAHAAIMARRCEDPIDHFNIWEDQFIVKESDKWVEPVGYNELVAACILAEEKGIDTEAEDFTPVVDVVTNNPVPIVDSENDKIHLVYCEHYDSAYYTFSEDDGKTWSISVEITSIVKKFERFFGEEITCMAAGPGHGLQLQWGTYKGRLIVPFWLAANSENPREHGPSEVGFIYSDDNGKTWEAGDIVPHQESDNIYSPNESQMEQFADGRVVVYSRRKLKTNIDSTRIFAISEDGVHNWSDFTFSNGIPEPQCLGSIIQYNNTFLYTLPTPLEFGDEVKKRINLKVYMSKDEGKTWPLSKTIHEGDSAYSDLTVDPENGWIYCLFEDGCLGEEKKPYNGQSCAKFNIDWIKQN